MFLIFYFKETVTSLYYHTKISEVAEIDDCKQIDEITEYNQVTEANDIVETTTTTKNNANALDYLLSVSILNIYSFIYFIILN